MPKSGNYIIKAYGATATWKHCGGKGAIIGGTFTLVRGEIIRILVGQKPQGPEAGLYSGGAGGTFVVKAPYNTDTSILVIAGGGGGAGNNTQGVFPDNLNRYGQAPHVGGPGGHGVYLETIYSEPVYNISGGSYGSAGTIGRNLNAGAGFYGSLHLDPTGGPKAFTDTNTPGKGAKISGDTSEGGFGGGGVAGDRGGGGGGYSGGGGANGVLLYNTFGPAGGGGSYNNGFNQTTSIGGTNGWDDHGQVEITFIPEFPIAPTPLYNFTSQIFGNYEALGRNGPTLTQARDELDGAPIWKDNLAFFDVVNGIQYWTVPKSGNYTIKAYGADARNRYGGRGAIIGGDFSLVRGEIIRILVGQRPEPYNTDNGGGAGGTFVVRTPYTTEASILVIAGGGGGSENNSSVSQTNANIHGQTGTQGGQGAGNDSTESNPIYSNGGTLGNGGNHGQRDCGGAGFNGPIGVSNDKPSGFIDSANPGQGGKIGSYEGGFGGGARHGSTHGGGGGGYSGGGGGINPPWQGGGGGSYNSGSNKTTATGLTNGHLGQGKVEITFIS